MNEFEVPKDRRPEAARLFNEMDVEETLNVLDKLDKAGQGDNTVTELIDQLTALRGRNLEKRDEAA
ncbi:hypothetical protein KKB10_03870 [Patescibacteria group bacterium]|nr:hypothetical protein [Patescibacteria group bacterium]MBU1075102.1 hypothetical protein [Patescibacteria group bacterium]MBU1952144.1 hypothetical protein [Patescibacteria group bacterium]